MSDTATAAPSNGATSKTQAAPSQTQPNGTVRAGEGKSTPTKASEAGETTPATPARIKIKDLEFDENDAYREISRARYAPKMLAEAEKKERAAMERDSRFESLKGSAKKDLGAIFKELGMSPEEAADLTSKYLYSNHIEPQQLTGEQREIRALKERISQAEVKEREMSEKQLKQDSDRVTAEQIVQIEAEILDAARAGQIPANKATIRRIAGVMERYEVRGRRLSIEQAADIARIEVGQETGEFIASASVDELRHLWGDKEFKVSAKKFLDWAMVQLRGQSAAPRPAAAPDKPANGERKFFTPQEFSERFGR